MNIPKDRICLYSSPFPDDPSMMSTIALAAELGLGGVELMNFCAEIRGPDPAAISRLASEAERKGLAIPCLTVGIDMLPDPDGAADILTAYARICADVGIRCLHHTIATDCSCRDLSESERERRFMTCLPAVRKVCETAASLGVRTIIEDQGFVFNGIGSCLRLVDMTGGKIGIVADVGNVFFVDEKPETFIRETGSLIVHAHIKDYAYLSDRAPGVNNYLSREGSLFADCEIGTGCVDFDAVFDAFESIGYRGMYALEFARIRDREEVDRVLARLTGQEC